MGLRMLSTLSLTTVPEEFRFKCPLVFERFNVLEHTTTYFHLRKLSKTDILYIKKLKKGRKKKYENVPNTL